MNYPQLWRSSGIALTLLLSTLAAPSVQAAGHTVRNGETFTSIARKYNVTLSTLQKANPGVKPSVIAKGQVIKIPGSAKTAVKAPVKKELTAKVAPKAAPKTTPKAAPRSRTAEEDADRLTASAPARPASKSLSTYRVRSGDSLVSIARKHGVSVADLVDMNGLDSSDLAVNQKIVVPGGSSAPVPTRPTNHEAENTVDLTPPPARQKKGDTPSRPAAPSVTPPAPSGTYYHVVKNGETLSSIARERGVSLAALTKANKSIDPKRLAVNTKLSIPGVQVASRQTGDEVIDKAPAARITSYTFDAADEESAPETSASPEELAPASRLVYSVSERDSMESIAREFNTTPKELRRINAMGPFDRLTAGNQIIVPWNHRNPALP